MASSIFGNNPMPGGNPMSHLSQLVSMLKGMNPNTAMNMMMQNNPQFAQFMEQCKGKTPEEVAQAYGVDLNTLRNLLK